jgi:hypothetical protein
VIRVLSSQWVYHRLSSERRPIVEVTIHGSAESAEAHMKGFDKTRYHTVSAANKHTAAGLVISTWTVVVRSRVGRDPTTIPSRPGGL